MKGIRGLAGLVLGGAIFAGWATLSWAQQPPQDRLPTGDSIMTDPGPLTPIPTPPPGPAVPGTPPLPPPLPPSIGPAGLVPPVSADPLPPLPGPNGGVPSTLALPPPAPPKAPVPPLDTQNLGPQATPGDPTGRQEPAVSLEWVGPALAKIGKPGDYTIAIRNVCPITVQDVEVHLRLSPGMEVKDTDPKAFQEGNTVVWKLGSMPSRQEKNLNVRLVPGAKGMAACQASVTFTGTSAMRIRVCEPKLVLKATAPEKVMVGDPATIVLTVTNPGDGPAEKVKIHANLSDGLENARGKNVDFEVGDLAAGETRSVQLLCGTKTGGPQTCDGLAEAEGDLKSQDKATVNVIMPQVELTATGPSLKYLDRKAMYTFKVTNPGDAPATNVTINDVIPPGFKFDAASDGGRHDFSTRTVSWFLGEMGPGQGKEVKLECTAVNPGIFRHHVTAQAARGLKKEAEVQTKVEGVSACLLEVVDTEDPIEVGTETSYEIRVTNTGSKTETDVKMVCTIPDKMQFKAAQGPVRYQEQGNVVIFEPLPRLAPKADAIYRISVKGLAPGDVRFKASLTSANLIEPVIEMESTRIYSDTEEGSSTSH